MASFVVHTVPSSPFGRAVLATLEEKGADYRVASLRPGAAKAEPHLSRHPFGRIPVLEHDEFMLYETQAILRYLDRILPAPCLTPRDARACARMDQVMGISDWYLFTGVVGVIGFQRMMAPRIFGTPPDETAIAAAMPKAHLVFGTLDRALASQDYFAGDAISLADMIVAPQVDIMSRLPEWQALTANTHALTAWHKRMVARLSLQRTSWERIETMVAAR